MRVTIAAMNAKSPALIIAIALVSAYCFVGAQLSAGQVQVGRQAVPQRSAGAEIILPAQLVQDKPGSLAVLDANGALAAGVSVDLSTGVRVSTDQTGRARFVVNSEPGPFLASIPGTEIRASTVIVAAAQPANSQAVIAACPREVTRSEFFTVSGSNFRGDADENRVVLAGASALVLAASPSSLEILPSPSTPLGTTDLSLKVPNSTASVSVDVISLRIERRQPNASSASDAMKTGKTQQLVVHVEGSAAPTPLAVLNLSPGVIELVGGAFQRVVSSGGQNNQALLQIRTVHPGDVSVSVQLAVRGSSSRDINAARRALERARTAANGDWAARVDGALERLTNEPSRAQDVLSDVERMLEQNPPPQVARFLESAWIELAA